MVLQAYQVGIRTLNLEDHYSKPFYIVCFSLRAIHKNIVNNYQDNTKISWPTRSLFCNYLLQRMITIMNKARSLTAQARIRIPAATRIAVTSASIPAKLTLQMWAYNEVSQQGARFISTLAHRFNIKVSFWSNSSFREFSRSRVTNQAYCCGHGSRRWTIELNHLQKYAIRLSCLLARRQNLLWLHPGWNELPTLKSHFLPHFLPRFLHHFLPYILLRWLHHSLPYILLRWLLHSLPH